MTLFGLRAHIRDVANILTPGIVCKNIAPRILLEFLDARSRWPAATPLQALQRY
ncbi:hypothetical protein [Pseudolysobacter antarcticus]|uniref:hypothetical protein n=1 Tax=Pseudolysobacter antarcticus TaxID=2511995 RepID=UPI0013EA163A|nr:hypothetical protein [Pseudolysobacter antarcticus]